MSRHERFAFRNARSLLAKAGELGVALPYRDGIEPLFEPLALPGGRRLANRLVVHPMEGADAADDSGPGPLTFRRYRRFVHGGSGLVWFEATAVEPEGRSNPHQLLLNGRTKAGFRALVEEARAAADGTVGSAPDPAFILQLTHSGRFAKPEGIPKPVIAQHNPWLDPLRGVRQEDPLVTDSALDRLKERFVEAAGEAAEAGFDGVDVKACHGYLVGELLGARNRPDSRYGGSFENRARFLVETIAAIRRAYPALILACRLGVFDTVPYPNGFGADPSTDSAGREDLSEPIALLDRLAAAGLEILNITIGIPAWKPHYGRPFNRPAAGGAVPEEHPLEGIARLIRIGGAVQRARPGIPVVGTGYSWLRGFAPNIGAGVLAEGSASLIGFGRMSFAHPDLALELRTSGGLDKRKLCTACSGCTNLLRAGGPAGCTVRDKSVYSRSEM
jgi:2,4-dienoyl-CoA reductase (NADPH2)